ncbi:MAG: hypothetical protein ACREJB_15050, partial [Planctomycetaceae bacterium]
MKPITPFLFALTATLWLAGCGTEDAAEYASRTGQAQPDDAAFAPLADAETETASGFDVVSEYPAAEMAEVDALRVTEAADVTPGGSGPTSGASRVHGGFAVDPATATPAPSGGYGGEYDGGRRLRIPSEEEFAAIPDRPRTEPDDATESLRRNRSQPRQHQAGTLTAGSLNDHANYDDFRSYLTKVMQNDPSGRWPQVSLGQRVEIRVVDAAGD